MQKTSPSAIWFQTRCWKSSPATSYTRSNLIKPLQLAKLCAKYAADKKALDIIALDLRGISSFTDVFVICSGTSEPHLKAIAGEIEERLKKDHDVRPHGVDGFPLSQWIVLDYSDVIVHIFHDQKRMFYGLEDLWGDAKRIKLPGA
ncbi:MAG TPA: ribosome silencing factor [Chthoniobacteraceae bacterium]|nr:ribosome silencing factor [Chthoniobacteraceae bacterium]